MCNRLTVEETRALIASLEAPSFEYNEDDYAECACSEEALV